MARRSLLALSNRLDDLEAVQFRHVDIEEKQIKVPMFRKRQRFSTIVR